MTTTTISNSDRTAPNLSLTIPASTSTVVATPPSSELTPQEERAIALVSEVFSTFHGDLTVILKIENFIASLCMKCEEQKKIALFTEWYHACAINKKTQDKSKMINFLRNLIQFIPEQLKSDLSAMLSSIQLILEAKDSHRLQDKMSTVMGKQATKYQRYESAKSAFYSFACKLIYLQLVTISRLEMNPLEYTAYPENGEKAIYFDIRQAKVILNLDLSSEVEVFYLLKKLSFDYTDLTHKFSKNYQLFMKDLMNNYLEIIHNDGIIPEETPSIVQKRLELYTNFLPRVIELENALVSQAESIKEMILFIKNFYFYLKLENLDCLKEQLKNSPQNLRKILFAEVQKFSKKVAADPSYLLKMVQESNLEPLEIKKIKGDIRSRLAKTEQFMTHFLHSMSLIEGEATFLAQNYQQNLFLYCPPPPQKKRFHPAQFHGVNSSEISPSTPSVQVETQPSKIKEELSIKPLNAYELMEEISNPVMWNAISAQCKRLGVKEALKDAQMHFNSLLVSFYDFLHNPKASLSRNQALHHMIDWIRHGSLAVEQMLSALDLQSNNLQSQEELKEHISHDLFSLLVSCKFSSKPLSASFRKWIIDHNYGEILIRSPNQAGLGNTPLESLIAKIHLFNQGANAFSIQNIFSDVLKFIKGTVKLFGEIGNRFSIKQEGFATFQENMLRLCRIISEKIESIEISEEMQNAPISLRQILTVPLTALKEQYSSTEIEKKIDNLLNHLISQLETEMNRQTHLNPLSALNHCNNVLLHNQMIVEEVLSCLMSISMAPDFFEDLQKHDLLAMTKKCQMAESNFTPEEIDFLTRGRMTRKITRYPASYSSIPKRQRLQSMKKIEQAIDWANSLSSRQKFTQFHKLDESFKLTGETGVNLEKLKAFINRDIEIAGSILTKVFQKHPQHLLRDARACLIGNGDIGSSSILIT
jgi:hypothetical protein